MNTKVSAVAAACVLASSPALAAQPVWALNYNQAINVVNAANNAELPFIPSPVVSDSLAADPAGVLYVADAAGTIFSVQGSMPLGNTGSTQIADLCYASGGLWGFSNAGNTVFFFDLGSASVTYSLAITSGLGANSITGIARNPFTGDLYLSGNTGLSNTSSTFDSLFLLDLNLASASLVGNLAHSDTGSYISDIEFNATGTLLAMTWFHRYFYSVNPADATTTLLSVGPHRDVTGFAVEPTDVPEAGTWAAGLVLGLWAWGQWRRRTGQR